MILCGRKAGTNTGQCTLGVSIRIQGSKNKGE